MSEWKPIQSAPKQTERSDDNCPMEFVVLLYDPDNSIESRIQVGFWNTNYADWQTLFEHDEIIRPTHWMPLPEPPK